MTPHHPLPPGPPLPGPLAARRLGGRCGLGRFALAAAVAGSVAACAPDRVATGSLTPRDVRERHPIVLTDAPRTLDVFIPGGGRLDARQAREIRAFAGEYRQAGSGPMLVQIPVGNPSAPSALQGMRQAMAEAGVSGSRLAASTYQPLDPTLASPIRLTFRRMQAKVASRCGLWPEDLGGSDIAFNASNDPYWNFGCATQSNFAAQVADPIDLVRGRPEGRSDAVRRAKDIENLRQGKDPSTQYRQDGSGRINQAIGN